MGGLEFAMVIFLLNRSLKMKCFCRRQVQGLGLEEKSICALHEEEVQQDHHFATQVCLAMLITDF